MDGDDVRNQSSGNAELLVVLALVAFGGYFAFVMLGGVRLDPTSTLWLDQGDIAQHYLGWHFFRGEPWMLPLGGNPRYGLDMGSSIVFTDSIPLLAIAFKAIRTVLPTHFQYAGLWMAFCFIAQGLSALLLLHRFSRNPAILFAGATLFMLSPVLVSRALGHFALMGHWTLLLALWLYFKPNSTSDSPWIWRALIATTALIHGYLLYFVLALWFTTMLRDREAKNFRYRPCLTSFLFTVLTLAIVLWLAGWFAVPFTSATSGGNYGQHAANLLSLTNPVWGSPLLPTTPQSPTTSGVEAINYLGAGVFLLCVAAILRVPAASGWTTSFARHKYLLLTTSVFAALAFSHNVYWGETLLFQFPLNGEIQSSLELIRGSGRLLWLLHYLVMVAAIVLVLRGLPGTFAPIFLCVAVAVQAYDLHASYRNLARTLKDTANVAARDAASGLKSPFWEIAATRYQEVDFFPISHSPPRYEHIALWAGDHHIAINAAYFGRVSVERAFAQSPKLETELTTGARRSHTLYIIQNRTDVDRLLLLPDDGIGEIDGYWIVAPDWFKHATTTDLAALLGRPKTTLASALR